MIGGGYTKSRAFFWWVESDRCGPASLGRKIGRSIAPVDASVSSGCLAADDPMTVADGSGIDKRKWATRKRRRRRRDRKMKRWRRWGRNQWPRGCRCFHLLPLGPCFDAIAHPALSDQSKRVAWHPPALSQTGETANGWMRSWKLEAAVISSGFLEAFLEASRQITQRIWSQSWLERLLIIIIDYAEMLSRSVRADWWKSASNNQPIRYEFVHFLSFTFLLLLSTSSLPSVNGI